MEQNQEYIDRGLHARLMSFSAVETSNLQGEKEQRKQEKETFLSGEKEIPNLETPHIDEAALKRDEIGLLTFKNELRASTEYEETLKQLYIWKINEKIGRIRMYLAAKARNQKAFLKYSQFVYGKYDTGLFSSACQEIYNAISIGKESSDSQIQQAAQDLENVFPVGVEVSPEKKIDISTETFGFISEKVKQEVENILDGIDIGKKGDYFSGESVERIFRQVLEKLGATDWKVEAHTSSKISFTVKSESKKVQVPSERKLIRMALKRIIAYQLLTHVQRSMKGANSNFLLASTGLDRYQETEEGLAEIKEQGLAKEFDGFSGIESYLAIGLTLGADGKKRNFREVYEILQKYYYLIAVSAEKRKENPLEYSQEQAWKKCMSLFEGTTGEAGVCNLHRMIYRKGNIAVWKYLEENPEAWELLQTGKFGLTHIPYLQKLGFFPNYDEKALTEAGE